ncbi:MAG: GFA family protein [Geminicoccales bacterium]
MTDELTGRCLCGAVTYRTDGLPLRVSHCHCEQCRRSSGGVALTLAAFNADQVTFSGIAMKDVRPTDFATRSFCPECGSHITFQFDDKPEFIAIMVGTLDQPEKTPAIRHNFASEKIAWVHLDQHLPMKDRWWNPPPGKGS